MRIAFPKTVVVAVALLCGLFPTTGSAQDRKESDRLLAMLESPESIDRKQAARYIAYLAPENPVFYQTINRLLVKALAGGDLDSRSDKLSWYPKALAASGDVAYRGTLEKAAGSNNKKLARYAHRSLERFGAYQRWYQATDSLSASTNQIFRTRNLYLSLLRSPIFEMKIAAAKRIYQGGYHDPAVLQLAEQELLANYRYNSKDGARIQALGWLCKVLGGSGDPKYIGTLETVKRSAPHGKVSRYASKALKELKS